LLLSTLLAPTLREVPAEAEVESHRLMLRAGLMRKVAAGIYTHLPLGNRAIAKVEAIVREEMDRQGAQELRLPIVQPAELWQETGRWAAYGDEMWKLNDRHGRPFCLGPTHEEIITDLVRREVRSWRQLPLILYQMQNKYRDEIRPRFGVMRSREFLMKDAYSFDRDQAGLQASYDRMYEAYRRIFTRCGLDFRAVEADSGAIGGAYTHEFMALADSGEAALVLCPSCGYAANVERAEGVPTPQGGGAGEAARPMERVRTPGVRSIGEVVAFLGCDVRHTAKILFHWLRFADGRRELVAALVRGDRQLNEVKLRNLGGAVDAELASATDVQRLTGAPVGSAGPVGLLGARIVADREVAAGANWVVGANEEGFHLTGVNVGRDFEPDQVADLRLVEPGDPCPRCGEAMVGRRGIEVGQVFQLGTKYSEALGARYLDETGRERPVVMGCYGIGVTRTVAAAIEQRHDANGIVWPYSIAPYHVTVVPVGVGDDPTAAAARQLYALLGRRGVEVVLDDRDERPGVKFKDADLFGFPLRVTVGRSLGDGKVELTERATRATQLVGLEEAPDEICRRIADGLANLEPR
jgi:prolyl-tRNA synthetase